MVSFGGTGKKEDVAMTTSSGSATGGPTGVNLYFKALIFQILLTLLLGFLEENWYYF